MVYMARTTVNFHIGAQVDGTVVHYAKKRDNVISESHTVKSNGNPPVGPRRHCITTKARKISYLLRWIRSGDLNLRQNLFDDKTPLHFESKTMQNECHPV